MKIGTMLNLEYRLAGVNKKYRCKVIEMNKNFLFIDYPIDEVTKRTIFPKQGTMLAVSYLGDDQSVYRFTTKVEARVKLRVPALAITYPDQDQIERIQRRQYVRIESAVDIAVHSRNNTFPAFTTVTTDISGGGLSIIIPNGVTITEQSHVHICFVLEEPSDKYRYIYTDATIIRVRDTTNHRIKTASLKFLSLAKNDLQAVIKFCFEKQRQARKKELQ